MTDDFYSWLRKEKFTIVLALVCAFIPFLEHIGKLFPGENKFFLSGHLLEVTNLVFIFVTLSLLIHTDFLINRDGNKKVYLYQYVHKTFGVNCELYRYGDESLFHRMNVGIKQFYYSWIGVWCIWLVLYINNLTYSFLEEWDSEVGFWFHHVNGFIENTLNLMNSCVLFFIYMVITMSTVNSGNPNDSRKSMHIGVVCLIFIFAIVLLVDLYSFFIRQEESYAQIQFALRVFIGIVAAISLMAVVGRLNSSFLDVPQWLMIGLYLYAAVQMLYPFTYEKWESGENKVVMVEDTYLQTDSLVVQGEQISKELYISPRCVKSNDVIAVEKNEKETLLWQEDLKKNILYGISFFGKICLFLMIRWIAKKKRFLFFLIQKAHSLSESTAMWRDFYSVYEGCPDKEK